MTRFSAIRFHPEPRVRILTVANVGIESAATLTIFAILTNRSIISKTAARTIRLLTTRTAVHLLDELHIRANEMIALTHYRSLVLLASDHRVIVAFESANL